MPNKKPDLTLFDLDDRVFRDDRRKHERADIKPKDPRKPLTGPRAAATALGRVRRRRVGPHR